jgi:hypothetical protein
MSTNVQLVLSRPLLRFYLAYFNTIDSKFCIGMGLLGLENLFDGDWTKSIAARTLILSETFSTDEGKPWRHCRDFQIHHLQHHRRLRRRCYCRRRRQRSGCRSLLRQ